MLESSPALYLHAVAEYAYALYYLNEYKHAEELSQKGLELLTKLNLKEASYVFGTEATFYHILGILYLQKWKLKDSHENLLAAFNLRKTYGSNLEFGYSNMNLGIYSYYKGELETARIYLESSIKILEELGHKDTIGVAQSYLGIVEIISGNLIEGEKCLLEALTQTKNSSNILLVTEPYYEIAYAYLYKNRIDEAKKYIDRMGILLENYENDMVNLRFDFITGYYYKKRGRLKYISMAQEKFQSIIERPILDTMIYVSSIKHYCDLLIDELKLSENETILSEVITYIDKLYDIGRENGAMSIVVESMVLKSKIALLQERPSEMLEILESARIVADAYKLNQLHRLIDLEIAQFADKIQLWERLKVESLQSDDSSFHNYLSEIQELMRKSGIRHLD